MKKVIGILAIAVMVFGIGCKNEFAESLENYNKNSASELINEKHVADSIATYKKLNPWRFVEATDKMDGTTTSWLSVESNNEVTFEFPYNKLQKAELSIIKFPKSKSIQFSLEKCQYHFSYYDDDKMIRIKFDENKPINFSVFEGDKTLSINNYTMFLNKMMKSKVIVIEVPFYQEGTRTFEFNVNGFDNENFQSNFMTDLWFHPRNNEFRKRVIDGRENKVSCCIYDI